MKGYTLITGASQGFGRALAIEHAKKSMNLVLVALPNSGLEQLSDFLTSNFRIDVSFFEMDLSSKKNCLRLYIEMKRKGISIKYLINNAGMLSNGLFEDMTEDYFLTQIKVNVATPTLLTKLFLDDFKTNVPSGILNVSSMASFFHLPRKQVYGGTKAYLLSFSKSLRKELKRYGISVSIVCPGGMNTTSKLCLQNRKLNHVSRSSILNPEEAARITLNDFFKGKEVIIPGAMNKIFMFLDSIIPAFIKNRLTANVV
ncbi:SDR family NAD(P)-dependent oxidoreductase [Sabulilitoribacter multivorans]|uniref:SDR family NAD(P)-dependent oxidoreductase n=1 Tax=Flaviramulus multivorans TaxID=1304750 RepID=A0ABS9IK81_9FLAO|nr:SDR family NAD(P)-dependent oxidoreductase [Flaviramulus multivorans]MCF7560981.1 SDR family NAD(P)-dependent oxidoreductase [Flaviramulus multivorans]